MPRVYIYMYRSTSFFKGTFWSPQMEVTNHLLKRSSLTGPRSRGHDLKDPSMFLITDPPRWSKGRPLTHVANDLMIVWKSPSPDSWQQTKFLKENKSCIALKKCLRRQIAIAFLQNTCQVWKLLFFVSFFLRDKIFFQLFQTLAAPSMPQESWLLAYAFAYLHCGSRNTRSHLLPG